MLRWMPENVSTYGGEIDHLFSLISIITFISFVLTYAAIIYALIRYRRSRNPQASYLPADRISQYGWILGLAVIVLIIDIALDHHGAPIWDKIKTDVPAGDVQVRVTAKQFNWEVRYPGPDVQFDTADDFVQDGEMHVPVDKAVHVTLTSKDVIHSFFLPNFRLKQDAMPGRNIPVWFQATKTGEYPWPCAELCGFGHTGMQGKLFVHNAADYEEWRKARWPAPPPAPTPEPAKIAPPTMEVPPQEAPKPEEPKQDAMKPAAPAPEAPKPEAVKPEEPQPADLKPEEPKSDAVQPAEPKQEGMQPTEPRPDMPQPEAPKQQEGQTEEKKEG